MSLLDWLRIGRTRNRQASAVMQKAANSSVYISASMSSIDRNRHDGKPPPFDHRAAMRHFTSWIHAAAMINATAVASNPLRLYVRSGPTNRAKLWKTKAVSGQTRAYLRGDLTQRPSIAVMRKSAEIGDDFEEVTDNHPVLQLLARSNPYINGYDLSILRVVWQELTGNSYLHVVVDPKLGVPTELWPMPPQWTEIIPDEQEFVKGYTYGKSSESKIVLEPDEVIHFRRPNPSDLFYGMGKLQAAWGAAAANQAIHELDLSMFSNHARPDYLMTVKGNAGDDQLEALETQIQSKLRGTRNAGHFLVSTAEIDLKPLQFPTKDLTGRDEIVEEIAAVFGVPISMLKANDPNLASATTGFASWREMTVLPLCRMDEEVLNQRLLPMFGLAGDAVLAYDNPVPKNRAQELVEIQAGVSGGWMTANEAREAQGLERLDNDPHADMLHVGGQPLGGAAPVDPALGQPGVEQPAMPLPAGEPTDAQTPPSPDTSVAQTALNGAQISSLVQLAQSAADGLLPVASVRAMASAAFPAVPPEVIESIFAPIVPRVPAAPEPQAPKQESEEPAAGPITKSIESIDTKPPESVASNARRALEVRESKPPSQRGMTGIGLARARDLANRADLSESTIRRMARYFDRHQKDKQGQTWDEQGPGWQAWMGWGGDEGWKWADRKVAEFDRARKDGDA